MRPGSLRFGANPIYQKSGGTLEKAGEMANHASTGTTQLDWREELSLDGVGV
jgi:hypothetical protein